MKHCNKEIAEGFYCVRCGFIPLWDRTEKETKPMNFYRDYRQTKPYELYSDAMQFAREHTNFYDLAPANDRSYWAGWYAARRATIALLAECSDMGLTQEQIERLEKVARIVAAD